MPQRVQDALELLSGLQDELQLLNLDDTSMDADVFSVTSRSTKATSILLAQLFNSTPDKKGCETGVFSCSSPKTETNKREHLPFHLKLTSTCDRIENSALVLECLNDMLIQEIEYIEAALVQACDELERSVGMNSFEIPKSSLFPLKKR